MRDGPEGPPGLGSIVRGRDQLCEEVWDAGEPVEVDATPSGQGRRARAGKPVAQRRGRQVGGMEHLDETERLEALGPDELLAARLDAWHDERRFAERKHLADGVVAADRKSVV